jgi:hypothetical protein
VLEGLEIGTVLYKTGDVDLRAEEVPEDTARVEKRCCHEQVHERGAITATVELLETVS